MDLRAGTRLKSAGCTTEVIVVRAPVGAVDLCCAGRSMSPDGLPSTAPRADAPEPGVGTLLGKRYVDEETGLEVLCTKAGAGALSMAGRPLTPKESKPLPASD